MLRPNPQKMLTVVIAVAMILVGLSATVFPIDFVNQALDIVQIDVRHRHRGDGRGRVAVAVRR